MRKDRKRKGQLNTEYRNNPNAGFSLVELLIAVTILAIIVVPLLHMFVTSTKINVKSRQTLRATTVAQDIMEGLKAYTLEEVSEQFAPPEGMSGDAFHYPSDGFYIVNSSMIQGGVRDLTEEMPGHTDGDEIYYFGIENLKMQGGEYDALIKLDASTYGANSRRVDDSGNIKNPSATGHDREFNGTFYAEIGSVAEINGGGDEAAKVTDSSYHENKKLGEAVLKDVKTKIEDDITAAGGTLPDDLPDDWDDLELEDIVDKRTIEVVLQDGGSGQCEAKINITYDCSYIYNGVKYTYTSNGHVGSEGGTVVNITRTFSGGNFYLFYYPIYKSGMVDNIQIKINDASKLCDKDKPLLKSIALVKQVRSVVDVDANVIAPDLTDAELWAKETAYSARIDISADTAMDGSLVFRTNADTNMIKNASTGERDTISGVVYTYNAHVLPNVEQCTFSGDTVGNKVTNIIYDAEITVYQTGAAKHFTESNFEDNDEVHRLASITNMSQ